MSSLPIFDAKPCRRNERSQEQISESSTIFDIFGTRSDFLSYCHSHLLSEFLPNITVPPDAKSRNATTASVAEFPVALESEEASFPPTPIVLSTLFVKPASHESAPVSTPAPRLAYALTGVTTPDNAPQSPTNSRMKMTRSPVTNLDTPQGCLHSYVFPSPVRLKFCSFGRH